MPKYQVSLTRVMHFQSTMVEVEAETIEAAEQAALEKAAHEDCEWFELSGWCDDEPEVECIDLIKEETI